MGKLGGLSSLGIPNESYTNKKIHFVEGQPVLVYSLIRIYLCIFAFKLCLKNTQMEERKIIKLLKRIIPLPNS